MANVPTNIRNREESKPATQFGTDIKNKAYEAGAAVTEKAKETASVVGDKAKDFATSVVSSAGEMASNVGQKAKDAASSAAHSVGDVATTVGKQAENATSAVGSEMKSLASTIREKGPHEGMLGSASSAVANSLESGGRYLQEEGLGGIGDELTGLIKRNPLPSVLIGIGIGFLIARATSSRSS